MEEAKALIRTAVRTFFDEPKQILIIDALMLHGVLHLEDIHDLLGIQAKEARSHLQPLRTLRFCTTHARKELSLKHNREVNREYYWCKFSDAVNVIKYRIIQLRQDITTEYQVKAGPDFWLCPRCKNTYKELDIMPSGPDSDMLCLRCGFVLDINPAAAQDQDSHEGIMRLNQQLSKFNSLIAAVDLKIANGDFKEPTFDEAFARRKKVPTSISGRTADNYAEVRKGRVRDQAAGAVNEDDININLTSAAALSKEEAEKEAERKRRIQDHSLLPEWHQGGAIRGATMDIRGDGTQVNGHVAIKPEDEDEKKPDLTGEGKANGQSDKDRTEQDIMEQYMLDMQREQAEADRKRLQEAEDDEGEDEEDEDEFEDVPGTGTAAVGTPISSQDAKPVLSAVNGLKREFEDDSSEAATPASSDAKRPKIEAGDESDEEEFEDV